MPLPTIDELQRYMRDVGWRPLAPGVGGTLWTKDGRHVGVPIDASGDPALILGVVARVAPVENMPSDDVIFRARNFRVDRTDLHAGTSSTWSDSIPLQAAEALLASARLMLRSAGTTAARERAEIDGHYAPRGDDVVSAARMGHTERGSFIIPIIVPIPDRGSDATYLGLYEQDEVEHPEPFARRVTRTFAQALHAVKEIVVDPGTEPTAPRLQAVVERGVSREFCKGLARILAESSQGEVQAKFAWAKNYKPPASVPATITMPAEAGELVARAGVLLHQMKPQVQHTFTGPIERLEFTQGEPSGYIAVSTVRNGRPCKIWVRLPAQDYLEHAVFWHQSGQTVIVEGLVEGGRGKRLEVVSPVRCAPLQDVRPDLFDEE
jgi:hypothetical protein